MLLAQGGLSLESDACVGPHCQYCGLSGGMDGNGGKQGSIESNKVDSREAGLTKADLLSRIRVEELS